MNSKEIRSQISKLLTDQQAIAVKGFNDTNRSAFDAMQKDVEKLEEDYNRVSAMEQRNAHQDSFQRVPRPGSIGGGFAGGDIKAERRRASEAFRQYAIEGRVPTEYRDILTTGASGAVIPTLFDNELVAAQKYFGPIAQKVKVKVTQSMAPMKLAKIDDTANGMTLLATEGTSSPVETDPLFSGATLGSDSISTGLVLVSFEAFEDSEFDLGDLLTSAFSERYARGLEKAITLGTDSAGTVLPNMPAGGLVGAATPGFTQTALASGIGYVGLSQVYGSLDTAYVQGASWVMHPTVRAALLGEVDGFGRPFWQANPTTSEPFAFMMGAPVVLNSSMPVYNTPNSQALILTDLSRTFLLRQQPNPLSILKLDQRYADILSYGFFGWSRLAGAIIAPTSVPAIASYKMAAS